MSGLLVARRGSLHRSRAAAAGYAAEVAADSPTAWWRMEETTGSTAADEIGTNDGTVFGANLNVSGASGTGSAASFDGTDDYIGISTADLVTALNGSYSIEAVFRTSSSARGSFLVQDPPTGRTSFNWNIGQISPGELVHALRDGGGSSAFNTRRSGGRYDDGAWHHVVFVTNRSSSPIPNCYVDGALDNGASTGPNAVGTFSPMGGSPGIGVQLLPSTALANFWNGELDEVAFYDTALPAARILVHAQAAGVA